MNNQVYNLVVNGISSIFNSIFKLNNKNINHIKTDTNFNTNIKEKTIQLIGNEYDIFDNDFENKINKLPIIKKQNISMRNKTEIINISKEESLQKQNDIIILNFVNNFDRIYKDFIYALGHPDDIYIKNVIKNDNQDEIINFMNTNCFEYCPIRNIPLNIKEKIIKANKIYKYYHKYPFCFTKNVFLPLKDKVNYDRFLIMFLQKYYHIHSKKIYSYFLKQIDKIYKKNVMINIINKHENFNDGLKAYNDYYNINNIKNLERLISFYNLEKANKTENKKIIRLLHDIEKKNIIDVIHFIKKNKWDIDYDESFIF